MYQTTFFALTILIIITGKSRLNSIHRMYIYTYILDRFKKILVNIIIYAVHQINF